MKNKQQRRTRQTKPQQQQAAAAPAVGQRPAGAAQRSQSAPRSAEPEERKVGVISGTPADAFDETEERKHDKRVAVYISVLAVLMAIAATGSNDAMKTAQQAGFQVNDEFAYYQAKTIRQTEIKIASDQLQLKIDETPNLDSLPAAAHNFLLTTKADYDKEVARLETDGRHGKKELLAKGEACENDRNFALAQHPYYDYSMAMLQIAIVLASTSIVMGTRFLLYGSGAVGAFGILLFLNGYTLVYGAPEAKHKYADALEKAGIQISLACLEGL